MTDPIALLRRIDAHPLLISKNYKLGKKTGWKYLVWRVQRPLIKFHFKIYLLFNRNTPWLCITAIEFFKKYLTNDMKGVEFGSGRSTAFFCSRSGFVVSIEHHKGWYDQVEQKLKNRGVKNVDYRYIPAQSEEEPMELPDFYGEWDINEGDYMFRKKYFNYFNALDDFAPQFFDYILVDGRARPECVFTSVSKLKSGGLLVLDNSERARYSIVFDKLANWKSYTCTSGSTDTTFWIKP